MALISISLTWMLLAAIVAGLCRAASAADAEQEPDGPTADAQPASPRPAIAHRPAFTKSLRRRASLHRA